jgi:hypothetical protein
VGRRTYLKWPYSERPDARFRIDGTGALVVDLGGYFIDPSDPPLPSPRAGTCLWALRPYPSGTEFIFRVDPSIRAWRLQWRTDPREMRLTLSANEGDLAYRTYHPWEATPQTPAPVDRLASVILIRPPSTEDGAPGEAAVGSDQPTLHEIGHQIRDCLEEAGLRVLLLDDDDETSWVAEANALKGGVCLCLRTHSAGEKLLAGCRIVTAPSRPDERSLDLVQTLTPRRSRAAGVPAAGSGGLVSPLRRWDSVFAGHSAYSHTLSWLLGLHLAAEFPGLPVREERWPVAFLGGLDSPGAILYVGDLEARTLPEQRGWEPQSDRLAAVVVRSLEAFVSRTGIGAGHDGDGAEGSQ